MYGKVKIALTNSVLQSFFSLQSHVLQITASEKPAPARFLLNTTLKISPDELTLSS